MPSGSRSTKWGNVKTICRNGFSKTYVCTTYPFLFLIRTRLTFSMSIVNGKTANVTLPKNLASGDYLLRHEIIALHLGNEPGGAEFYPSCSQIRISASNNSETLAVLPTETVSLPGAYSDNDPGIFVPTVCPINSQSSRTC